jgi:hypothetical protein
MLLLSGCVRHYHHGSYPETVVIKKPSKTVIVKKPTKTVVVKKPGRTVVVKKPAKTVVVQKPAPTVVVQKKGPPPWAPAHGYRHKHQGADLQFDSRLGVYVVLGHPEHYFHVKWFYRWADGSWHVSTSMNGSWETVNIKRVPSKLRAKHVHKHKHKRAHPAKHRR